MPKLVVDTSDDDDEISLGAARESQTIGAARTRIGLRGQRRAVAFRDMSMMVRDSSSDDCHDHSVDGSSRPVHRHDEAGAPPSDTVEGRSSRWKGKGRGADGHGGSSCRNGTSHGGNSGGRRQRVSRAGAGAGTADVPARDPSQARGTTASRQAKTAKDTSDRQRRGKDKRVSDTISKRKESRGQGRKKIIGLLGIPVNWDANDFDYDDSDDEDYTVPKSGGQYDDSSDKSPHKDGPKRRTRRGKEPDAGGVGHEQEAGRARLTELSAEVMLSGIIRPYLLSKSKCALQRTCKEMRDMVNMPEAWDTLDLRAEVIGRRTMKSGRTSIMSSQPLFFLARAVLQQPRFSLVTCVDLRGLNLGAMGSSPDLLVTLVKSCPRVSTLNVGNTYLEREGLPLPDSAVEKVIAEHLPGLRVLSWEMDDSNRGLKLLLEGCRHLSRLHIGSRRNRRGDSASMYPSDAGMKVFTAVGAPHLETISLADKVNVGTAGLKCLLDPSACPRLKTLVLARMNRVTDQCLKAVTQSMDRIESLTFDQCSITAAGVLFVVQKCPQLKDLVVCSNFGVVNQPQSGRALLDFMLAEPPTNLTSVQLQRPRETSGNSSVRKADLIPSWLREDLRYCEAVSSCAKPSILFTFAESVDERVEALMAGE